ncbi:MAG: 50S ribosomal protein L4 [Gemmatimonadales bacterium]
MIEAPHFSSAGARNSADFGLPEALFDGTVNEPVLHEAVTAYMANQRQGTAMTKTRGLVSGGNQKPWKQKGTGRARQGSTRSPNWPGGGKVFGPVPRDYRIDLPKKVRQLARKSALNARAADGGLMVIERFELQSPRTREIVALLTQCGVMDKKVLLLTHGVSEAVYLSARNLPRVRVQPYSDVTSYDILWSDVVLVEEGAFSGVMAEPYVRAFVPLPKAARDDAPRTPKVKKAAAPAKPKAEKPKTAKPAAKKAAKSAAKKPAAKAAKRAPKAKSAAPKKSPASKKPAPKKKGGK